MSSSSSNDEQDVKDVQITLVDCFVSNADENSREKMTTETRRNARESIMELENALSTRCVKTTNSSWWRYLKGKKHSQSIRMNRTIKTGTKTWSL